MGSHDQDVIDRYPTGGIRIRTPGSLCPWPVNDAGDQAIGSVLDATSRRTRESGGPSCRAAEVNGANAFRNVLPADTAVVTTRSSSCCRRWGRVDRRAEAMDPGPVLDCLVRERVDRAYRRDRFTGPVEQPSVRDARTCLLGSCPCIRGESIPTRPLPATSMVWVSRADRLDGI